MLQIVLKEFLSTKNSDFNRNLSICVKQFNENKSKHIMLSYYNFIDYI